MIDALYSALEAIIEEANDALHDQAIISTAPEDEGHRTDELDALYFRLDSAARLTLMMASLIRGAEDERRNDSSSRGLHSV